MIHGILLAAIILLGVAFIAPSPVGEIFAICAVVIFLLWIAVVVVIDRRGRYHDTDC